MNITLEEYTDLLKKYEELRQDKIRILNKYYVEKDDLKQEIERLNNILKEVREWIRIVQTNEDKKHLEPNINTDELDYILEILDKGE